MQIFTSTKRSVDVTELGIKSYNVLLQELVKGGAVHTAESVLRDARAHHVRPDATTAEVMARGLCAADRVPDAIALLDDFHRNEFPVGTQAYHALITALSNYPKSTGDSVAKVVTWMRRRSVPLTADTYGLLMSWYVRRGQPEQALEYWEEMKNRGLKPTTVHQVALVAARGDSALLEDQAFADVGQSKSVSHELIVHLLNNNKLDSALERIREDLKGLATEPADKLRKPPKLRMNDKTYTAVLKALAISGRHADILDVMSQLPASYTQRPLLQACLMSAKAATGRAQEAGLIFRKFTSTTDSYILSTMIHLMIVGLAHGRRRDEAERFFKDVLEQLPSEVSAASFEAMIQLRCDDNDIEGAAGILHHMRGPARPRAQAFGIFLRLLLDEVTTGHWNNYERIAEILTEQKHAKSRVIVTRMVRVAAQGLNAAAALSVIRVVAPRTNVQPTPDMYHDIIVALINESNVVKANDLIMEMKEQGLRPLAETVHLLSRSKLPKR
jgi:pentatricopeptide repeat protein